MSHISTVEMKTQPVPTPVLDELTDAATRYFELRPARKLRVGGSPIPQLVAIYALQASRYTLREWFGEGRDLEALAAELELLDPTVSFSESRHWRQTFGHAFPRQLTFAERHVLSQVAVELSERLRSVRSVKFKSDRRYTLRDTPERLLQPSDPRRRRRRRPTFPEGHSLTLVQG